MLQTALTYRRKVLRLRVRVLATAVVFADCDVSIVECFLGLVVLIDIF